MALYIQPRCTGDAMLPAESAVIQLEVRLMSIILLVGIFVMVVIYVGFYAFIYKTTDCVRRLDEVQKVAENRKNSRRRWFQPFCNLNADLGDLESTEWFGDWSSDCDTLSNTSADDELD
ncbi:hypothetical protein QTP88_002474 [Uroleucon formosanum]